MSRETIQKTTLIALVIGISLLFYSMIKGFVVTLLLAGIFAGILRAPYEKLITVYRERKALASVTTILLFLLAVVIPVLIFFGGVVGQAYDISKSAAPWIENQIREPDQIYRWLSDLPGFEYVEPYRGEILERVAAIAGNVGNFAVRGLSAATTGTVAFFFQFFVFLYALFFFLIDGEKLLRKILYYLPLTSDDEMALVQKFSSVARATIKGTLVIGVIQGGLAGAGLAVAGVQGAMFWGTVMMVLSIIPGIGTALVWIPAVIYLLTAGKVITAVLLAIWCALVVGSVDNLLRPRLIGKDTKMPDLLILLGTIGGIILFGVAGFIIGPIVAALFVSIWELYGKTFEYALVEKSPPSRHRYPPRRSKPDTPRRDDSRGRGGDAPARRDSSQRRSDEGRRPDNRQRSDNRPRPDSRQRSENRPRTDNRPRSNTRQRDRNKDRD